MKFTDKKPEWFNYVKNFSNNNEVNIDNILSLMESVTEIVKERISYLLEEKKIKAQDLDKQKLRNSIKRIIWEKDIIVCDWFIDKIDILINNLIDFIELSKDLDNQKNIKDIDFIDILSELKFIWENANLKEEKKLLIKNLFLSFFSELFRVFSISLTSKINTNKESSNIILWQSLLWLLSEYIKYKNKINSQEITDKIRWNLVEKISDISLKNNELWYYSATAFLWYWHIINWFLNNIIPNLTVIWLSSAMLLKLNMILGTTAIWGFIWIWVLWKKSSKLHTKSHNQLRKILNKIILKNKKLQNIEKDLKKLSKKQKTKEFMASQSQFLRALPTYIVEIIMTLEFILLLDDNTSPMILMASLFFVRNMRTPIAFIVKTWNEQITKAVSDTQKLTKLLKNELKKA